MIAKDLISNDFPTLLPTDDGNRALNIMENYLVNELAITENNNLLGVISLNNIYDFELFDEQLSNHQKSFLRTYIHENQPIFEVIKSFNLLNTSILPVVNKKKKYIGSITYKSLIKSMNNILSINEQGYYLKFSLNFNDYSATEITNIIEQNDAKLLSLHIENKSAANVDIFIKIQTKDIEAVLQSFERFKYDAILLNTDLKDYKDLYSERMDNFLHYLNI